MNLINHNIFVYTIVFRSKKKKKVSDRIMNEWNSKVMNKGPYKFPLQNIYNYPNSGRLRNENIM